MTHLEETVSKFLFQSNSLPSKIEDIRKGQHDAPDTGPCFLGKERFREGDFAHRPESTEES